MEDIVAEKTTAVDAAKVLGQHEGEDVLLKNGKFGLYVTWGKNTKSLKCFGNRPVESITFEEIEKFLDEGSNNMREVSPNISIRRSKKGFYVFFKTAKMKKPQSLAKLRC